MRFLIHPSELVLEHVLVPPYLPSMKRGHWDIWKLLVMISPHQQGKQDTNSDVDSEDAQWSNPVLMTSWTANLGWQTHGAKAC